MDMITPDQLLLRKKLVLPISLMVKLMEMAIKFSIIILEHTNQSIWHFIYKINSLLTI